MPKTIAVSFQKGGVGKTTTAFHLSQIKDKKVLAIDFDPQCNFSRLIAPEYNSLDLKIFTDDLFDYPTVDYSKIYSNGIISLIPSHFSLFDFDLKLSVKERSNVINQLRVHLKNAPFDLIIIDCGPSQSTLTIAAEIVADLILIPIECRQGSFDNLQDMLSFLENSQIKTSKLFLPTKLDARISIHKQFYEQLKAAYGEKVLEPIPLSTCIEDIYTTGKPCLDEKNKAGKANLNLLMEVEKWLKNK